MSDIFCIWGLDHTLIISLDVYLGALSPSAHRNCECESLETYLTGL